MRTQVLYRAAQASSSQCVTLMTVALHVTMTCLDVNKRHMLGCQMGDVIVQLLLKLILFRFGMNK